MRTGKNKISVKQLLYVLTIIVSSPATRLLPKYAADKGGQAGWVSPLVCVVPFIVLILMIDSMMKKYEGRSMTDIIILLLGKLPGKLVLTVYLLWTIWLTAMHTRFYAERLTSSIYPNMGNNVFIIVALISVAYTLRSGFTAIARMSEILLPFIGTMLVILSAFLVFRVRADNVLPVYFNDIVPILKASTGPLAILAYLFFLFFLSDMVVNMKSFRFFGYVATYINISSMVLVLFITIGVMGYSITQRAPMPVLITVKQVSLMDTIENIEAIIIAIWIFADFTLISASFVIAFNLIKSIFKLSDTKPLINTYAALIYFLSMGISNNRFELEKFSMTMYVPINIILGYGFPAILFLISKLRKRNIQGAKTN